MKLNLTQWLDMQDLATLADYLDVMYGIKVSPRDLADRDSFGVCDGAFVANVVEKIHGLGLTVDAAMRAVEAAIKLSDQQKSSPPSIDNAAEVH